MIPPRWSMNTICQHWRTSFPGIFSIRSGGQDCQERHAGVQSALSICNKGVGTLTFTFLVQKMLMLGRDH